MKLVNEDELVERVAAVIWSSPGPDSVMLNETGDLICLDFPEDDGRLLRLVFPRAVVEMLHEELPKLVAQWEAGRSGRPTSH